MLKNYLGRIRTNLSGWRTRRKIVVIESDDWGSIRMPSREVYQKCLAAGYPVNKVSYEMFDSILNSDDLEKLFDLLNNFKDKNGNHPIITANCVVANPDFDRIEKHGFQEYYYELITETFKRYPEHKNNFNLWKEGIKHKVFLPQFHAREHLNVSKFMNALKSEDQDVHFGFKNRMPGCITKDSKRPGNSYVESTRFDSPEDKLQKLSIFLEGLDLFESLFGFKSESIIPPNYLWSPDFNEPVSRKGVSIFQGNRKIAEPNPGGETIYHPVYLGQLNQFNQTYLIRNVIFEPSMFKLAIRDPVSRCLAEMNIAFRMQKPAIITSHRINYVGYLVKENSERTLTCLEDILKNAIKRWPEIEFLTSNELGNLILKEKRI